MSGGEKWSVGASMYLTPRWSVGGSLGVSSTALRFVGGENRDIPLGEITEVRVARQRWWHPRKTLQVVPLTGEPTWFLVNRQVYVADRILEAVRTAGGEAARS